MQGVHQSCHTSALASLLYKAVRIREALEAEVRHKKYSGAMSLRKSTVFLAHAIGRNSSPIKPESMPVFVAYANMVTWEGVVVASSKSRQYIDIGMSGCRVVKSVFSFFFLIFC